MPYAKIEPSGCAEFHGNVQIRLSFYLEPGDIGYDKTHVQVPIIPPEGYQGEVDAKGSPVNQKDYDKWLDSLPKEWQLNPFHNHFIYADPDVTEAEIEAQINFHLPNFYKAWYEDKPMRSGWDTKTRIRPLRYDKLEKPEAFLLRKTRCLEKAETLKKSTLSIQTSELGETFPATDIDIGAAAIDRNTIFEDSDTAITLDNSANDTGTLDTVKAWAQSNITGFRVGTFLNVSGNDYECRDSVTIGAVTSGSEQSFSGLSFDVETGDYIGCYFTGGTLEMNSSGFAGIAETAGEQIDPTDQATYSINAGNALSLYGTGETAGWTTIAKVNGVASADIAKINGVAVADIAKVSGVAV